MRTRRHRAAGFARSACSARAAIPLGLEAHASRDHTLAGPLWEGFRESRRCSRDTYPESYFTEYTSIRRLNPFYARVKTKKKKKLSSRRNLRHPFNKACAPTKFPTKLFSFKSPKICKNLRSPFSAVPLLSYGKKLRSKMPHPPSYQHI